MVEGESLERELGIIRRRRPDPGIPQRAARDPVDPEGRLISQVGDHDHALDGGDPGGDSGDALQAVDLLAGVAIPVGTEQDARRDLAEAVNDAGDAEVWRARGPDRAEA